jgi:signal transduction histidine kinase
MENGMKDLAGVGRVGVRLPGRRPGTKFAGERSEAAAPTGPGSGVRDHGLMSWRPRITLTLAAALVAALLGVFAYVLATSQATSRHEAQQRFGAQATIAAALTQAIFSAQETPQAQAAQATFGSATVSPKRLTAYAERSHMPYAFIAGPDGRLLASSAGTPAAALGTLGRPPVAVRHALTGEPWLSDLLPGPSGTYLIEQAIPFSTAFGRRVEVLAYPAALLAPFLSNYLVGALPDKSAHGFVVDGTQQLIGASVSGVHVGQSIKNRPLLKALASNRGGYDAQTGGSRYLVAAPIKGSAWRVAISEPTSKLYPAVVGSEWWVMWAVFAAFAVAALGGLYLLRRTVAGASQMAEQAHAVESANVALRSANAELDAFSYSVSHDLRAPLRAIDGFSLIVVEEDDGELSDSQRRYLQLVRDNTQAMGHLIDDLLAFSRLANQPIQRRRVSTLELVEEAQTELLMGQNGRSVEFRNGELPVVDADPVQLRLVFVNLIENALKYSRDREPAQVSVDSEMRDGQQVFVVSDNGVGFDMRYSEKLFQVFQRLHRAEEYEGTGVGLAIVHRIITRHGGRVWAEGELGAGARFYFTLTKGAA